MTALVSAELLRLRTVRSPRYIVLGVLAFTALLAVLEMLGSPAAHHATPASHADSLRSLALQEMIIAAVVAASMTATDFKRGTVALTYMVQPDRWRVTLARTVTYAALGAVLAALTAGVGIAVGLVAADPGAVDLDAGAVVRTIAGAMFGGAAFATLGVLAGTIARNPTVATTAVIAPSVTEAALQSGAVHPYLPLGLAEEVIGIGHVLAAPVAMALLVAYPLALAAVVRTWALARDIT
jgi:ABC-type transport system involved in multi-copper enzyme maturation permease subunit